ncbi:hypothetical protein LCGC14_1918840 [marine sediment metagenome]|uniref:Uncharacterized protein n=1 Tax=marine sediment metagenome TaxID=412755 RepID=A0A0F9I5D9_9ZZZZ
MRYTESKDGIKRANMKITIRLSQEELAEIKKAIAFLTDNEDPRSYLANILYGHMYLTLPDLVREEEKYQAFAKGSS